MKNRAYFTQPTRRFPKKIHRLFHSIYKGQSVTTQPILTHLACVWLASCQALGLKDMGGQSLSCKEIDQFNRQKGFPLCTPHPPGARPREPRLNSANT